MKPIMNLTNALVIAVAIVAVGGYFTYTYQQLKAQENRNEAQYQCALSSRFTTKDANNNEVWYPVQDLYDKCLKNKNI